MPAPTHERVELTLADLDLLRLEFQELEDRLAVEYTVSCADAMSRALGHLDKTRAIMESIRRLTAIPSVRV